MKARLFMTRFEAALASGAKRQTIRAHTKRPQDAPKVGDLESWRVWDGKPYRSKQREVARVKITYVRPIRIEETFIKITNSDNDMAFWPDSLCALQLAQADGFRDYADFLECFLAMHPLPFEGLVINAEDAA